MIDRGADINSLAKGEWTSHTTLVEFSPLHLASNSAVAKVLIQNGADVNAVDDKKRTALFYGSFDGSIPVPFSLQLLCFGAEINEEAINEDKTTLLGPINDRLRSLREGNGMETTLMSDEEKRFMWNLAFCFTWKHRVAAFKAYYVIRSFITYNGIFMALGYGLGNRSIWRKIENNFRFM